MTTLHETIDLVLAEKQETAISEMAMRMLLAEAEKLTGDAAQADAEFLISRGFLKKPLNAPSLPMMTGADIQKLAKKFHLRFLPISFYKGTLPPDLAQKVRDYEKTQARGTVEYAILAPKKTFDLLNHYDPILFARSTDPYVRESLKNVLQQNVWSIDALRRIRVNIATSPWAVVARWGNDTNIFRRILGLLPNRAWCWPAKSMR